MSRTGKPGRGRRRVLFWLRLIVVLFVVAVLAVWAALESAPAAERLRTILETRGSAALGAPVRIGSLEIDILPFHLELRDVWVGRPPPSAEAIDGPVEARELPPPSAPGTGALADDVLARVDRAIVDLSPWALLDRRISVLNLELDRPAVRLELPLETGDGAGPMELEIRRLRVRDGNLLFAHRSARFSGELEGVSLRLAPEREGIFLGPFSAGVGELRVAGGRLDLSERNGPGSVIEPLEIDMAFALERSTLIVDRLQLVAGESRIEARGPIHGLDSAELELQADAAVDDVFKVWLPPGPDDHGGRVTFRGNLELRAGVPVLAGHLATDGARLSGLQLDSFAGDLQLHENRVQLRNMRAELFDGVFAGSLDVNQLDEPARTTLIYEITSLDAAALTRWSVLDGWRASGTLDASGRLSWNGAIADTAVGSGRIRLDLPRAESVELARRLAAAYGSDRLRDGAGQSRDRHAAPALPLPARADIRWRLASGTLSLQDSILQLPATTVRVNGRVDFDGELLATARVESTDLRMLDHLVAQYRTYLDGAGAAERFGVRGAATLRLELRGSLRQPVISGQVDARDFAVQDLSVGQVSAVLQPVGGFVVLDPLRVTRRAGSAVGSARLRVGEGGSDTTAPDYDLRLRLDGYDLAAEPELADRARRLAAAVSGSVRLRGPYGGSPAVEFDVSAAPAAVDDLRLDRVVARGSVVGARVTLQSFVAVGFGGTIDGALGWSPGDSVLDADLVLRQIDLEAVGQAVHLRERLVGRLTGDLRLSGPLDALDGEAAFTWSDAGVSGLPMGTVVAAARAERGIVALRALGHPAGDRDLALPSVPRTTTPGSPPTVLPSPDAGWSLAATVSTRTPYPAAVRLSSEAGVVAGLLQRLGQTLPPDAVFAGQLDAEGRGQLSRLASWRASASVAGFRVQQPPGFALTAERIEAQLADGRVTAAATLQSELGPFQVDVGTDLQSGAVHGRLEGTIAAAALRLWNPDLQVQGTARVALSLAGSLEQPSFSGGLEVREFAIDQGWLYPISDTTVDVELREDVLHITRLEGLVGTQPFSATGTLPLAALLEDEAQPDVRSRLELTIQDLPVAPVLARSEGLSALISGGRLSGDLHLQGRGLDPGSIEGSIDIRAFEIRMRDYDWAMSGEVEATLRGGRILLPEGTQITGTRTDFVVAGSIDLAPLVLDLTVEGRLGLEPLNVLSPVWGTGGSAVADLRIHGPVEDLLFQGSAQLQSVVLSPPPLRQPIEAISARLEFEDRRVRVENLEGELGGGTVTGSGEMFLRNNSPGSFRFNIDADNALVRLERDVQVRASADLVYDGTPERSLLSGAVRLIEGRYRRELEADDAILELLEAPETDPDPVLASVTLDLRVTGDRGLHIDNNLAEIDVTADYDIRGTLAEPVMLGRSVILDGELYWNDHIFEVLRGTVEFNNPFETEPFFEVRARTEIRRYIVTLNFSGSFQRGISFDYTSTPTLSDLDLFNLLAFGEEPESEVLQDPYRYQRALGLQATRYLTDAYLSEVERGAERLFGVDRFRLSPTLTGSETDATARLTIGKRLAANLYVTYSRLLSNSEDQLLIVEYQLSRTTRLKGTRDEDGSFAIDFLVQRRIR